MGCAFAQRTAFLNPTQTLVILNAVKDPCISIASKPDVTPNMCAETAAIPGNLTTTPLPEPPTHTEPTSNPISPASNPNECNIIPITPFV